MLNGDLSAPTHQPHDSSDAPLIFTSATATPVLDMNFDRGIYTVRVIYLKIEKEVWDSVWQ